MITARTDANTWPRVGGDVLVVVHFDYDDCDPDDDLIGRRVLLLDADGELTIEATVVGLPSSGRTVKLDWLTLRHWTEHSRSC